MSDGVSGKGDTGAGRRHRLMLVFGLSWLGRRIVSSPAKAA